MSMNIERKTCWSADGVKIIYSVAGAGEPALLFIHGGLADRSFWDEQLKAFAGSHRAIALDLAGHGESGLDRKKWGIPEFGADVRAVVEAENLNRVVLIGNSLGGPTAVEAALLLPGRAIGVIGVDTFQSLDYRIEPAEAKERAETFRRDFPGSVKGMVRALFHPDADPAIREDAERRMAKTSPQAAYAMFLSMAVRSGRACPQALGSPPGRQRRHLSDGPGRSPAFQGRFRRCRHEAHGSLPDARTPGGIQPPLGEGHCGTLNQNWGYNT